MGWMRSVGILAGVVSMGAAIACGGETSGLGTESSAVRPPTEFDFSGEVCTEDEFCVDIDLSRDISFLAFAAEDCFGNPLGLGDLVSATIDGAPVDVESGGAFPFCDGVPGNGLKIDGLSDESVTLCVEFDEPIGEIEVWAKASIDCESETFTCDCEDQNGNGGTGGTGGKDGKGGEGGDDNGNGGTGGKDKHDDEEDCE